jgi:TP901 family phage tail tape measure protein
MSVRTDHLNLVVSVNGNAAKKEYSELKARQAQIRSELQGMTKNTAEYIEKSKELADVTQRLDQMRGQMDLASLSMKDLRKEISRMRSVRDELDPGSQAFQEMSTRIREAENRMHELRTGTGFVAKAFNFLKSEIASFGALAIGALGINYITGKIGDLIQRNSELSDSYTDVAKTTGLSTEQVKELSSELSKLETRTGKRDLLGIAEIGGRVGITKIEELKGFVTAMNQINVAIGDQLGDPEEVSRKLGKIVDVFQIKDLYGIEDALIRTGSAINELGMASTANEGYLVNFTNRMGGIAPLAKISLQEILGLGATLDSFGQTAEVSSTALSKLFVKMTDTPEQFAKYAGMSVEEFRKLIDENFMAAFIKMLEGVKDNSAGMNELVAVLGDMGIEGGRVTGVLGVLANNTATLQKQIDISNQSFAEGVSITEEYNLKNNNLAGEIDKLRKKFAALWMNDELQKFLAGAVTKTNDLLSSIKSLGQWISRNATYIKALIAAYVAYRTALALAYINALRLQAVEKGSAVIKGILTLATTAYHVALILVASKISLAEKAQRALNLVMSLNPYAAIAALVAGLSVALTGLVKKHQELKRQFEEQKITIKYKVQSDEFSEASKVLEGVTKDLKNASGDKLFVATEAIKGVKENLQKEIEVDELALEQLQNKVRQKDEELRRQDEKFMGGLKSTANRIEREKELAQLELDTAKEVFEQKKQLLTEYEQAYEQYSTKLTTQQEDEKAKAKELTEEELKRLQELKDAIAAFERERLLASLSANQRDIEAIGEKYEKWLKLTKKFSSDYNKVMALMFEEIRAKQKEQDDAEKARLRKMEQDLILAVESQQDKVWLNSLEGQEKEIATTAQHYDNLYAQLETALKKQAITSEQYNALEKMLLDMQLLEIAAIREKYRLADIKAEEDKRKKIRELDAAIAENPWSQQDPFELERRRAEEHYRKLKELNEQYYEEKIMSTLEYEQRKNEIIEQSEDAETFIKRQAQMARLQANIEAYNSLATAASSFMTALLSQEQEMTKQQKAATLMQLTMNTASAIGSLVEMSQKNPANAATMGIAGKIQFASGLIQIMGNIAMAMRILTSGSASSGNNNQSTTINDVGGIRVPQRAKGGYTDVTGEDDDQRYRARLLPGFEGGFLGDPSLVLAGERGREYFVNNQALQNPIVARVVAGIDALSKGNLRTADFQDMLTVVGARATRSGRNPSTGEAIEIASPRTPQKPSNDSDKPNPNREIIQAINKLNSLLESGIKADAYVGDQTIIDFEKRQQYLKQIEKQSE